MQRLEQRLSKYIGPHTARLSVKTFAHKSFGVAPAQIHDSQVPDLVRALRPLMRSMLGEEGGERLVRALLAEYE